MQLPKAVGYLILLSTKISYKYKLDAETTVNKQFRNPRTRDYSVSGKAKPLLRASKSLSYRSLRHPTYLEFNYGNLFKSTLKVESSS